jgi:hypothetical protein
MITRRVIATAAASLACFVAAPVTAQAATAVPIAVIPSTVTVDSNGFATDAVLRYSYSIDAFSGGTDVAATFLEWGVTPKAGGGETLIGSCPVGTTCVRTVPLRQFQSVASDSSARPRLRRFTYYTLVLTANPVDGPSITPIEGVKRLFFGPRVSFWTR